MSERENKILALEFGRADVIAAVKSIQDEYDPPLTEQRQQELVSCICDDFCGSPEYAEELGKRVREFIQHMARNILLA